MILQTLVWIFMVWGIGLAMLADAVYRIGQDDEEEFRRDAAAGRLTFTVRPAGPGQS